MAVNTSVSVMSTYAQYYAKPFKQILFLTEDRNYESGMKTRIVI